MPALTHPAGGDGVEPKLSAAADGTFFVLYLNERTWVGAEGLALANEVRVARRVGIPIVMLHENDAARGGCAFACLFKTTPTDLINEVRILLLLVLLQCWPPGLGSQCGISRVVKTTPTDLINVGVHTAPLPVFQGLYDALALAMHAGDEYRQVPTLPPRATPY